MDFHKITWNFQCDQKWRTPSSNSFSGLLCFLHFLYSVTPTFPLNSMDLLNWCQWNWKMEVPWNSWKHRSHRNLESRRYIELHGISSNCESPIFDDTGNATKFYWTLRCISFDGIPWNSRKCLCHRNWENKTSMDSNGIPCNHPCHLKWQTRISIGFHGISPNIEFINFDDNLI